MRGYMKKGLGVEPRPLVGCVLARRGSGCWRIVVVADEARDHRDCHSCSHKSKHKGGRARRRTGWSYRRFTSRRARRDIRRRLALKS
jgi:hypothetical protein